MLYIFLQKRKYSLEGAKELFIIQVGVMSQGE